LLGVLPRLAPAVADTTRSLNPAEQQKLKQEIVRIQRRFPQLVLQVVMHEFGPEHPFSMHVFWLFNAGNFAGDSRRGKDNHALLLALDPTRGEAAIMSGYGLEPFLNQKSLNHLLELGGPAWENSNWAEGIFRVLDDVDELLESISIPNDAPTKKIGEF
jgi:uncharacterized membrane protein YgcG